MKEIDYKETDLLKKFTSSQSKIIDPRHTGVCEKHKRKLAEAIKRARFLGLMAFTRK